MSQSPFQKSLRSSVDRPGFKQKAVATTPAYRRRTSDIRLDHSLAKEASLSSSMAAVPAGDSGARPVQPSFRAQPTSPRTPSELTTELFPRRIAALPMPEPRPENGALPEIQLNAALLDDFPFFEPSLLTSTLLPVSKENAHVNSLPPQFFETNCTVCKWTHEMFAELALADTKWAKREQELATQQNALERKCADLSRTADHASAAYKSLQAEVLQAREAALSSSSELESLRQTAFRLEQSLDATSSENHLLKDKLGFLLNSVQKAIEDFPADLRSTISTAYASNATASADPDKVMQSLAAVTTAAKEMSAQLTAVTALASKLRSAPADGNKLLARCFQQWRQRAATARQQGFLSARLVRLSKLNDSWRRWRAALSRKHRLKLAGLCLGRYLALLGKRRVVRFLHAWRRQCIRKAQFESSVKALKVQISRRATASYFQQWRTQITHVRVARHFSSFRRRQALIRVRSKWMALLARARQRKVRQSEEAKRRAEGVLEHQMAQLAARDGTVNQLTARLNELTSAVASRESDIQDRDARLRSFRAAQLLLSLDQIRKTVLRKVFHRWHLNIRRESALHTLSVVEQRYDMICQRLGETVKRCLSSISRKSSKTLLVQCFMSWKIYAKKRARDKMAQRQRIALFVEHQRASQLRLVLQMWHLAFLRRRRAQDLVAKVFATAHIRRLALVMGRWRVYSRQAAVRARVVASVCRLWTVRFKRGAFLRWKWTATQSTHTHRRNTLELLNTTAEVRRLATLDAWLTGSNDAIAQRQAFWKWKAYVQSRKLAKVAIHHALERRRSRLLHLGISSWTKFAHADRMGKAVVAAASHAENAVASLTNQNELLVTTIETARHSEERVHHILQAAADALFGRIQVRNMFHAWFRASSARKTLRLMIHRREQKLRMQNKLTTLTIWRSFTDEMGRIDALERFFTRYRSKRKRAAIVGKWRFAAHHQRACRSALHHCVATIKRFATTRAFACWVRFTASIRVKISCNEAQQWNTHARQLQEGYEMERSQLYAQIEYLTNRPHEACDQQMIQLQQQAAEGAAQKDELLRQVQQLQEELLQYKAAFEAEHTARRKKEREIELLKASTIGQVDIKSVFASKLREQ